VPENFIDLAKQRMRWQIGLADSLIAHWSLLFKPSTGMVGTVAFPFFFFFELLGPVLEVFGYLTITSLFFMGLISTKAFFALLTVAIGMGLILSITALLFDQISFRVYQKNIEMVILFLVAIAENFGYRQLTTLWRFMGLILWVFSKNNKWDSIKRRANWDQGSLSKG
jgi:cellulose synthase/poly-beta-1,6-N-acetylglucosamine synthase-like glycosyltransferase